MTSLLFEKLKTKFFEKCFKYARKILYVRFRVTEMYSTVLNLSQTWHRNSNVIYIGENYICKKLTKHYYNIVKSNRKSQCNKHCYIKYQINFQKCFHNHICLCSQSNSHLRYYLRDLCNHHKLVLILWHSFYRNMLLTHTYS